MLFLREKDRYFWRFFRIYIGSFSGGSSVVFPLYLASGQGLMRELHPKKWIISVVFHQSHPANTKHPLNETMV